MRYFLMALLIATPVWAQNSQPVWSTEYGAERQKAANEQRLANAAQGNKNSLPPRPTGRSQPPFVQQKSQGNVQGAWSRQWTPIQNLTGFSQGQAQQFIQGVRENYAQGSKETLANARDWALILGSTGLVGDVTATGKDWFQYVSQDLPGALMSQDPKLMGSTSLMGGGLGAMGYPGASIAGE